MSESWNFGSIMESRSTVEAVGLANGGMSPILGGGGGVCTLSSTALLVSKLASWLANSKSACSPYLRPLRNS